MYFMVLQSSLLCENIWDEKLMQFSHSFNNHRLSNLLIEPENIRVWCPQLFRLTFSSHHKYFSFLMFRGQQRQHTMTVFSVIVLYFELKHFNPIMLTLKNDTTIVEIPSLIHALVTCAVTYTSCYIEDPEPVYQLFGFISW